MSLMKLEIVENSEESRNILKHNKFTQTFKNKNNTSLNEVPFNQDFTVIYV